MLSVVVVIGALAVGARALLVRLEPHLGETQAPVATAVDAGLHLSVAAASHPVVAAAPDARAPVVAAPDAAAALAEVPGAPPLVDAGADADTADADTDDEDDDGGDDEDEITIEPPIPAAPGHAATRTPIPARRAGTPTHKVEPQAQPLKKHKRKKKKHH